jgi:O-6-methylguanine DNA methyltransferase
MNTLFSTTFDSPIGTMLIGASNDALLYIEYADSPNSERKIQSIVKDFSASLLNEPSPYHQMIHQQLDEYFTGERKEFELKTTFFGTDFQQRVWQSLMAIPYGTTTTYKQQSLHLLNPLAIRAIASTNAKNCISIVVPCHRVVGTNGSLTGYSDGIWRKRWLLDFEKQHSTLSHQQITLL